jgi:hypothetical protein
MGLGRVVSNLFTHSNLHPTNHKLVNTMLQHLWCSDKPRTTLDSQDSPRLGLGGSHHLPPYSILYASSWSPYSNDLFVPGFPKGSPETAKVRLPQLCGAITFCSNLWSRWGCKQSFSFRQELSNGVSHSIYTHRSRVDSQLFVVESQTVSLTPDLFFCHKLCCRCLNGSCKPILNIYTSIVFQWYKELSNARCFDLYNRSLKVQESIETPTPKRRVHLRLWVFILTLFLARTLKTLFPWSRAQG